MPGSEAAPIDARVAALRALIALLASSDDAAGAVPHAQGPASKDASRIDEVLVVPADPREAALARELCHGAVAYGLLYDTLADRFLKPGRQPIPLRAVLRLGCHQLFGLDRIPVHAAVAASIDALRQCGDRSGHRLTGVANAVLRKLAGLVEQGGIPAASVSAPEDVAAPLRRVQRSAWPDSPALRLSLPDLLLRETAALIAGDPVRRLSALTLRPHLCTRTRPHQPAPRGRSILRQDGAWTWWEDPHECLHGPVADGRCVVQDRSQGIVAELALGTAGLRPGDRILDCCAAPGGKALALADAGLRVLAADASRRRLRASLLGQPALREVPHLVQDALRPALAVSSMDAVLVDAPCSNSGVFGRRPEAIRRYRPDVLARLAALQRSLLASAARLTRSDGRLIYATCSISPQENQAVAHTLPGWRLRGEHLSWPDAFQGGGYVAVLVRA